MAKLLKLRRGTTSQHGSFTGAEGEVTVDTDKETLVVHDGSTAGGHAVAAEDMANVSSANIVGRLGSGSVVNAKLDNTGVTAASYTNANITINNQGRITSAASGSSEGTSVLSTGVTAADKFLKADQDGSCSWQTPLYPTPTVITVADESSTTSCNVLFTTTASGNLAPKTGTNLTFNSSTGDLTATKFTGALVGNAATATNADTVDNQHAAEFYGDSDTSSATVGPGWISVADGNGWRRHGEIFVSDSESSDHSFIRIDWMRSYGDTCFSIINCGGNNNRITGVRVLTQDSDSTYGNKILQVYGTVSSNYRVSVKRLQNQTDWTTFAAVTPVVQDTLTGYSVLGSQLENLDTYPLATQQGIQAGGAIRDSKGNVRSIPYHSGYSSVTLTADMAGHVVNVQSNCTVPNSVFATGDTITIVNEGAGNCTITQGSGFTLYNSADGSTGNKTLGPKGILTIWWRTSGYAFMSGSGLS